MDKRGDIYSQHVENLGPNNAAWNSEEFRAWRAAHAQRLLDAMAILQAAHVEWEREAHKFGITSQYKNGVHGVEAAYGIGRLHRTAYKSAVNLLKKVCR